MLHRTWPAIIAHADMDAFYAAVEQLDDPALRGRPVLVGPRSGRGVVLTASYEARPFGVGSAMPMARAMKLCPHGVVVPPRFERYEAVSRKLMAVLADFSPKVEAISLDEAFVDMSGAEHLFSPPDVMARRIREAIRDATGLPASVGISGTKYVAKVASGMGKPNGIEVVPPEQAAEWLAPLPVSRLWGAGPVTQKRLEAAGISRIGDLVTAEPGLVAALGSVGAHFLALARGEDPRPVARRRSARSMGSDRTLSRDVSDRRDIARHLARAADRLGRRLRRKRYLAHGVRIRLKTADFRLLSRQRHILPTDAGGDLLAAALELLHKFPHAGPFRLVGLAAFDLEHVGGQYEQLGLFDDGARQHRLEAVLDAVAERFGEGAVRRARDVTGTLVSTATPNLDFVEEDEEDGDGS